MTLKYESEILFDLMKRDGDDTPSDVLPYESELKEKYLEQVEGAYPKLQDYRPEWLNYNLNAHLPADFPVETLSNVTEATVDNVVPYAYRSAILKGHTLNNITKSRTSDLSISDTKWWYYSDNNITMRNNEKYLIKFNTVGGTNINYNEFRLLLKGASSNQYCPLSGGDNGTIITVSCGNCNEIWFNMSQKGFDSSMTIIINNVMVIPYQDGIENWDIPYFEGMQSVKMPDLTTTGKNLFDGNKVIENKFINSEGIIINSTNFDISDYIEIIYKNL